MNLLNSLGFLYKKATIEIYNILQGPISIVKASGPYKLVNALKIVSKNVNKVVNVNGLVAATLIIAINNNTIPIPFLVLLYFGLKILSRNLLNILNLPSDLFNSVNLSSYIMSSSSPVSICLEKKSYSPPIISLLKFPL